VQYRQRHLPDPYPLIVPCYGVVAGLRELAVAGAAEAEGDADGVGDVVAVGDVAGGEVVGGEVVGGEVVVVGDGLVVVGEVGVVGVVLVEEAEGLGDAEGVAVGVGVDVVDELLGAADGVVDDV
jgi:hypothetical protein